MTVDPKYADLPWIANDGTDVYETEDLPEVDQEQYRVEDTSIESFKINMDSAKKAFKGKMLNADDVDFSDRIKPYVNTGYIIEREAYTAYPHNQQHMESVLDKFQRLQHEVRDFVNEVEQMKSSSTENAESHKKTNDLINIGDNLLSLINNFTSYKTHCSLGAEEAVNVEIDEDLCGFDTKEMFEEIQKNISQQKKDDSNQNQLSWEKYYKSPLNKELTSAKIASIDQRIQRLEAAIGCGARNTNLSSLSTETATKSLVESVKILTSRCHPLKGGPNVDRMETRLVNLQTKLQTITEKRDLITEADRQNKIAELFNLYQKWQQVQLVLPVIVKRMEGLHELHNQAMLFSETMTFMDKNQKEMVKNIRNHEQIFKKVEQSLEENLKNIKSNIDAIQAKMDKI